MMKKILAVAIVSAFAAPAFAATSNVDIYGVFTMSVDMVDGGNAYTGAAADAAAAQNVANTLAGAQARLLRAEGAASMAAAERRGRVTSNNSLIGFKGAEDLGGGLSAVWQVESSLQLDAGALNTAGTRNTFAGLSSKSLGTLTAGIIDTPLKTSIGKLDVFGNTVADYRAIIGTLGGSLRPANSIHYASPSFGGLDFKLQTAAQNENGNGTAGNPKLWSGSVSYNNGPIFATVAHETGKCVGTVNNVNGGGTNIADVGVCGNAWSIEPLHATTAVQPSSYDLKLKTTRVGAGYNFGSGKVGLAFEKTKLNGTESLAGVAPVADAVGYTRNAWYLSGSFNVTNAIAINAAYTKAGDFKGVSGGTDSGASQYSVGATYGLSKRTSMYALYTKVRNDSDVDYSVAGGSTGISGVDAAAAGQDPSAFSLGMRHSF